MGAGNPDGQNESLYSFIGRRFIFAIMASHLLDSLSDAVREDLHLTGHTHANLKSQPNRPTSVLSAAHKLHPNGGVIRGAWL